MRRAVRAFLMVGVFLVLVTTPLMADVIHVQDYLLDPVLANPAEELAFVQDETGDPTLEFLAKRAEDGDDEGPLLDFFNASFMGISADLSWDLTGTGFQVLWVLIKDGAFPTSGTVQHLYGLWSVTEAQAIIGGGDVGFFDLERDVSHASFFGIGDDETVPEPSTLLVLGAGLLGLAIRRRRQ